MGRVAALDQLTDYRHSGCEQKLSQLVKVLFVGKRAYAESALASALWGLVHSPRV